MKIQRKNFPECVMRVCRNCFGVLCDDEGDYCTHCLRKYEDNPPDNTARAEFVFAGYIEVEDVEGCDSEEERAVVVFYVEGGKKRLRLRSFTKHYKPDRERLFNPPCSLLPHSYYLSKRGQKPASILAVI